jgi:hypothetical protein
MIVINQKAAIPGTVEPGPPASGDTCMWQILARQRVLYSPPKRGSAKPGAGATNATPAVALVVFPLESSARESIRGAAASKRHQVRQWVNPQPVNQCHEIWAWIEYKVAKSVH